MGSQVFTGFCPAEKQSQDNGLFCLDYRPGSYHSSSNPAMLTLWLLFAEPCCPNFPLWEFAGSQASGARMLFLLSADLPASAHHPIEWPSAGKNGQSGMEMNVAQRKWGHINNIQPETKLPFRNCALSICLSCFSWEALTAKHSTCTCKGATRAKRPVLPLHTCASQSPSLPSTL